MAGARVAAGVLFLDEDDRVLMVVPSYQRAFEIPGGGVEPGESPVDAAKREVAEELAIAPPVGRLLVADWWTDSPDGVGGPKLLLVFSGGTLSIGWRDEIAVDGTEVVDHAFVAIDDVPQVTVSRLAHRVAVALSCERTGTTAYMENGETVDGGGPRSSP